MRTTRDVANVVRKPIGQKAHQPLLCLWGLCVVVRGRMAAAAEFDEPINFQLYLPSVSSKTPWIRVLRDSVQI